MYVHMLTYTHTHTHTYIHTHSPSDCPVKTTLVHVGHLLFQMLSIKATTCAAEIVRRER